jgi:hypothetical protein
MINIECWIYIYVIRTHYIFVSKDVRFRGYFSQPDRIREQVGLGNTGVRSWPTIFASPCRNATFCGNPGARIRTIQFCVAICVIRGACIEMVRMSLKINVSLCEI